MPAKSGKVKRTRRTASKSGATRKRNSSKVLATSAKANTSKQQKPVELVFRPRVPADDPYILNLTENQLGPIHAQSFGEPFPREQFHGYLQSGAPTVVVEHRGKPVGYYSYLVGPDGKMHVSALVIDHEHQSGGIGTEVMSRLEEDAKRQRVHTLEVFVQEGNRRSVEFTKKLGFVEVYRMPPNSICFQKVITGARGASVAGGPPPGQIPPQAFPGPIPGQPMPGQVPGQQIPGQPMPGQIPGQPEQGASQNPSGQGW